MGLLACLQPQTSNESRDWRGSLPDSFRSPAPNTRTSAERWQTEEPSLESCCSVSSDHGTARTEAQRMGLLLVLPPQTSDVSRDWRGSLRGSFRSPAPNMRTSADSWQPEEARLESFPQPHLPMALLTQRHRDLGCLLVLPPQTSEVSQDWRGSVSGSFRSPDLKMRTSAASWQPEGASLESCCSFSSAHGTAHTEAQR